MPQQNLIVAPGPRPGIVLSSSGQKMTVPAGWQLLRPGDAGLTRRVKAAGPTWTVAEKKGRRVFSHGIWAPAASIAQARASLDQERASPAYQKKLAAAREKREREHLAYTDDFYAEVFRFLDFHACHTELALKVARAVTAHATPVGSGTVARTKRISIERRAEAAVIAWLRHQTTAYDEMSVKRIKGERRRVRRELAGQSRQLMSRYRRGEPVDEASCPLRAALQC